MHLPNLERLKAVFEKFPQIQSVYLFGSRAAGRARPGSDLDLAVVSKNTPSASEKIDILSRLSKEGFCDVDLVFLPKDNIVLQNGLDAIGELKRLFADF